MKDLPVPKLNGSLHSRVVQMGFNEPFVLVEQVAVFFFRLFSHLSEIMIWRDKEKCLII